MTDHRSDCISSPPDSEKLAVEVFQEGIQLAGINHEADAFIVEQYPRPDGEAWSLPFDETLAVFNRARNRLGERTGTA